MLRKLILVAALFVPTAVSAKPAAEFVKDAVQGDYSEMTLGRLIQSRGASAQVRSFGAMLVRDHSNGLAQAQQVAARLRLRVPLQMMPEARSELVRLHHLGGRPFDLEVRRYMIQDHLKDIAEFRQQARSGDRATSGFAAATVPVLRRHLDTARSIRA